MYTIGSYYDKDNFDWCSKWNELMKVECEKKQMKRIVSVNKYFAKLDDKLK